MALMANQKRTQKDQDEFEALLNDLNITGRETKIDYSEQKTMGLKKRTGRTKGKRKGR